MKKGFGIFVFYCIFLIINFVYIVGFFRNSKYSGLYYERTNQFYENRKDHFFQ